MWGSEVASDCSQECLLISLPWWLGNSQMLIKGLTTSTEVESKNIFIKPAVEHTWLHTSRCLEASGIGGKLSPSIELSERDQSNSGIYGYHRRHCTRHQAWAGKECLTLVFVGQVLAHWHFPAAHSWGSRVGLFTQCLRGESLPIWCHPHANCPYTSACPQFQEATLLQPCPTHFSLFWTLPGTLFRAWFYTVTYQLLISSRYFLITSCYIWFLLTHTFHKEMSYVVDFWHCIWEDIVTCDPSTLVNTTVFWG